MEFYAGRNYNMEAKKENKPPVPAQAVDDCGAKNSGSTSSTVPLTSTGWLSTRRYKLKCWL